MIAPEQRAEIRRLYYAEHWRVGTIATTLGVHHGSVRTVRPAARAEAYLRLETLPGEHYGERPVMLSRRVAHV